MALFAIGDLHFSGSPPSKPMDKFGDNWTNHREIIAAHWQEEVKPEDTVILCGDTSWSLELPDAIEKDFTFISSLPGQKVLLKGNHDYWWTGVTKMANAVEHKFLFLHNNFIPVGNLAVCGTRGWNLPSMSTFTEHDAAMYSREGQRLEHSLSQALAAGYTRILVALHYPPLYKAEEDTVFTELCRQYKVEKCIYGHVHGKAAQALNMFQGEKNGTDYRLVAADFLDFKLKKLE